MSETLLESLQNVRYSMTLPLQFTLDDTTVEGNETNKNPLECRSLLRVVPGKRLVFSGYAFNKKVIIKLFVHKTKAKKHWQRECRGAKLLTDKGVLTPKVMAQGLATQGFYYLIFPYIEGQNLAQFCSAETAASREKKLMNLMSVLATHHNAGLLHQDLHYGNFYLSEKQEIYTLDGEEVKAQTKPLSKQQRLDNLALFLAQTFDFTQSTSCSLLQNYLATYLAINAQSEPLNFSAKLTKEECQQFWQRIKHYQQQRIKHYLKKMLRNCSDVISQQSKQGKSLCRREYYSPFIEQLVAQPEQFFQDKQSKFLKQGNTCTVKSVWIDNECYVIKRYNPKSVVYKMLHKGQKSRARKSWLNAHLLRFMGISTPEPVALLEQYGTLRPCYSYFICKFQAGENSWDFFCDNTVDELKLKAKQRVADKLLAILQHLCDYNITHGDLKGSNILIDDTQIYLLDLDAMTQSDYPRSFNNRWQRDKQRFLKNWDKKDCYKPWKIYFKQLLF